MKKLKWHGIIFALLILFLYVMGTYDIFMMLSHNAAYYTSKGYGESAVTYILHIKKNRVPETLSLQTCK